MHVGIVSVHFQLANGGQLLVVHVVGVFPLGDKLREQAVAERQRSDGVQLWHVFIAKCLHESLSLGNLFGRRFLLNFSTESRRMIGVSEFRGGQFSAEPVFYQLIAITCFGFNPARHKSSQQRGFVFFILRENVFNGLHQFPLGVQAELAHIRNAIFGLQQVLEVNILLISCQFVGDNLLRLADFRKVFVTQQMHGEAYSRGAIFKQGGAYGVCGISGGYRCGRKIRIAGGHRGEGCFILWRGTGDHVPGALVVGQAIAIAPGEVNGAFFRQVIEHREISTNRLDVVLTAASFDASFFQLNVERQGGACFGFGTKPDNAVRFPRLLRCLD